MKVLASLPKNGTNCPFEPASWSAKQADDAARFQHLRHLPAAAALGDQPAAAGPALFAANQSWIRGLSRSRATSETGTPNAPNAAAATSQFP